MKWHRLALIIFLLLAGCHRGSKQPPTSTVPVCESTTPPPDSPALHVIDSTTISKPGNNEAHTMKLDTAETTNLRLFARKQRTIYSPDLLAGIWHRDDEHEEYLPDGTGRYWKTGDDVSRDEAQTFLWTMDSNLLVLEFHLALGGMFYRQYVVTFVDDESLVYRDNFDRSFMWDKDAE